EDYNAEMSYYGKAGDIIYDYYDLTNGILYANNFEDLLTESSAVGLPSSNLVENTSSPFATILHNSNPISSEKQSGAGQKKQNDPEQRNQNGNSLNTSTTSTTLTMHKKN